MPETGQADEFAFIRDCRGSSGKGASRDSRPKDIQRALKAGGLGAEISRYQAVSNLVQRRP